MRLVQVAEIPPRGGGGGGCNPKFGLKISLHPYLLI